MILPACCRSSIVSKRGTMSIFRDSCFQPFKIKSAYTSIIFLDLLNSPDGFKCIFYYALVQARIGHSLYVDRAIDLLLHAQLPVIFRKYVLFFGYGFQYLCMYTAILPDVKRSE